MTSCDRFTRMLAAKGAEGIEADPKLRKHAQSCEDCATRLADHPLDDLLEALPSYTPSASLVETVIGQAQHNPQRLRPPPRTLRLAVAASFAFVMVAAIGMTMKLWIQIDAESVLASREDAEPARYRFEHSQLDGGDMQVGDEAKARDRRIAAKPAPPPESRVTAAEIAKEGLAASPSYQAGPSLVMNSPSPPATAFDTPLAQEQPEPVEELERIEVSGSRVKRMDIQAAQPTEVIARESGELVSSDSEAYRKLMEDPVDSGSDLDGDYIEYGMSAGGKADRIADQTDDNSELDSLLSEVRESIQNENAIDAGRTAEFRQNRARQQQLLAQAKQELEAEEQRSNELKDEFRSNEEKLAQLGGQSHTATTSGRLGQGAAGEFGRTQAPAMLPGILGDSKDFADLTFQDASGYWSSPYVPGDPEIRALSARLNQIEADFPDQLVVPYDKGFDAPDDAALNLHLRSDASAIDGPTRVRLQVGIQAVEHRAGRRPAMNLAAVLDIPEDADDTLRIQARALLDALAESQQAGDHFALFSTRGGKVLEGDEFRYGPLQLAYRDQFEQRSGEATANLNQTIDDAYSALDALRDPNQALGSSSVLLISASTLSDLSELAGLAHTQALEGTTLSVFPLGNQPDLEAVDHLVQTGLGHRRLLSRASQAQDLIEEELASSSRAVARSARLSIRLSPHVRLIEVLDSDRLDEPQSQRVREIEQSMDQRLQRNRGIVADRGDDEDGIQIIIPSVYTGDGVSVLVDVLVDKPGPVAEVTLRYKDLVFMNNGSERAQLNLNAGNNQPGPMQRLVQKDLLAHQFAKGVRAAAQALGEGNPSLALAELESLKALLEQARLSVPTWQSDPEIQRDIDALEQYIRQLSHPDQGPVSQSLTDSLKYAAWRKTHQAHAE